MTVNVTKPALNIREKLAELDKPSGIAGEAMLRADSVQEQRNLIGAGRKNLILNGGFDVWQRGAGPFSGYSYGPDRFRAASTANRGSDSNEGYVAVMTGNPTGGAALWTGVELTADALSQFKIGSTYTISARVKSASRISAVVNYRPSGVAGGHTVDSTFNSSDYKGGNNVYETLTWTFSPDTLPLTGDVHLTVVFKTESANDCTFSQVQLELGSVATDFEHRSYGEILADCQRFYEVLSSTADGSGNRYNGVAWDSSNLNIFIPFKVTKRSSPAINISDNGNVYNGSWVNATGSAVTGASLRGCTISIQKSGGYALNKAYFIVSQSITADAEL